VGREGAKLMDGSVRQTGVPGVCTDGIGRDLEIHGDGGGERGGRRAERVWECTGTGMFSKPVRIL